jgi:hypothetical protein
MAVTVDTVPVQAINMESTEVEKMVSGPVIQKEVQLVEHFQQYLESHDREVMRYRIIPLGSAALHSDLADVTEDILYEAKKGWPTTYSCSGSLRHRFGCPAACPHLAHNYRHLQWSLVTSFSC